MIPRIGLSIRCRTEQVFSPLPSLNRVRVLRTAAGLDLARNLKPANCRLPEKTPPQFSRMVARRRSAGAAGRAGRRSRGAIAQAAPSLLVQPDRDGEPTIGVAR